MYWNASFGESYGMPAHTHTHTQAHLATCASWESIEKHNGTHALERTHSGTHTTEHAWNAACVALGYVVSVRTVIVVECFNLTWGLCI